MRVMSFVSSRRIVVLPSTRFPKNTRNSSPSFIRVLDSLWILLWATMGALRLALQNSDHTSASPSSLGTTSTARPNPKSVQQLTARWMFVS